MPYKDIKKQRAYQNEWMKRRRLNWLAENGPCRQCGSSQDLEVDHIDPQAKVTHRIWSYTKEKRDRELMKCQALCRPCHAAKTLAYRKRA